ncbi:MAG: DinB family protein [Planctomycetota bacterium]|jgi:uncharacterized damage-inducible protein DinB
MSEEIPAGRLFLESAVATFRSHKRMAERAIKQVSDKDLHRTLDANANSIAVIMKHISGNMRSRWTDFLTSDGEKPWRGRDNEFVDDVGTREALMEIWESGWKTCLDALSSLGEDDLTKTVTIRGEGHTVTRAILRNLTHAGYHVGQIMILARHFTGEDWEVLTIPRGKSDEYNRRAWKE